MTSPNGDVIRPGSMGAIYTCSKLKLDSLFLQWVSLPESQQLVSRGTN